MPFRDGTKCFLFAWVPAWGAGLFVAAAVLAKTGLVAGWTSCGVACTFPIADAIPPLAKLVFGALLGALMWLARGRRPATPMGLMLRDAVSGGGAALLVFTLLPDRFGLTYTDMSGWTAPAAIHVFAGALGGALGTLLETSCRQRMISE